MITNIQSDERKVNVTGLVNILRNNNPPKNGKDFAFDMSELIDNSIDADATTIDIKLTENNFLIRDNGHGMTPESLSNALDIGFSSKKRKIGRYGIGFKNTTMRLGGDLSIETSVKQSDGTLTLSKCKGLSYSANKPEIKISKTEKAPHTYISLALNPGLLKSRWTSNIVQTLRMIYTPILETGKVDILFNGKKLLPELTPGLPVYTKSFRDIEIEAYISDDFVSKEGYLYKGTTVVFGNARSLVIGSNYLLEDLSDAKVNYEDLRVFVKIAPNSEEISASTSKNGFVLETHHKEYEEFLDESSEAIQALYKEYKKTREKEQEDKKTKEALKELSKHLNQSLKELGEELDLFAEGSGYMPRDPNKVVEIPKSENPTSNERKERNDKGQSRNVRLEIVQKEAGPESRIYSVERETGTNLFRIIVNTDHNFFKILLRGKDKIDMGTFNLSLAPQVLSDVILFENSEVSKDHLQDTISFMMGKIAELKSTALS